VTSVFHLHNNRSCCELNVDVNGQRLKHDPYPVYVGVTLDWILSYREHLPRSVAKLKSRNNLITKLAGTSWGACTFRTSALALCYTVAEYCCPVWARSSYTDLIDTQLHSAVRLTSGCLQPTQLSWLPVLSNVAPFSLRRKAATDSMLQIIEAHLNWPAYADVFEHPPPQLASWCPVWSDMMSVDTLMQWIDRRRVLSTALLLPTLLSNSQFSISFVIHGLWWTVSRQVKAHVVLTVIVANDRPWTTLPTRWIQGGPIKVGPQTHDHNSVKS